MENNDTAFIPPRNRDPWTREETLADGNLPEDIDEPLYKDMNGDYI